MTTKTIRTIGALVVLVSLFVLALALAATDRAEGQTADTNAAVGDSLTAQAAPYFGGTWRVDGLGFRTMDGSGPLARDAATGRRVIVIALGTNDANQPTTMTTARARALIDQIRSALNGTGACRVWVNVKADGTTYGPAYRTDARTFNTVLAARVNHVGNWNARAKVLPPGTFDTDGLHFADVGAAHYSAALQAWATEFCPAA